MKYILSLLAAGLLQSIVSGQTTLPIFRLNTNMHSDKITSVSVDAQEKYILTASEDKTAKLWDAQSGKLIKTLRIPIDNGYEGSLRAAAISPHGEIAVMGGFTGSTWDKMYSVYVINLSDSKLIYRIKDLPEVVVSTLFSPDGKHLAVGLNKGEIRICKTSNWSEIKKIDESLNQHTVTAFSPNGYFAAASDDGNIRLYNDNFELVKTRKTNNGQKPISVSFSPDGNLIAVGYADSKNIEVLDAKSLVMLYEPDIKGAETETQRLNIVTFSSDGNYLIAGGSLKSIDFESRKLNFHVRVWAEKGKAKYNDYIAAGDYINNITPLKNGKFIVCSTYPELGVLNIKGQKEYFFYPEVNNYKTQYKGNFKVNDNATEIGITPMLSSALFFSIEKRSLQKQPITNASSPETKGNNIEITNWCGEYEPKINGNRVSFLHKNELCQCVDVANDSKRIAFGTSWNIHVTDEMGKSIWSHPVTSPVMAINISGVTKTLVASFENGTIGWFDMNSETELTVTGVADGSIAQKQGLQKGDIIRTVDGVAFKNDVDFQNHIKEKKKYIFKVLRNKVEQILTIDKTMETFGFSFSFSRNNHLFTLYLHPDNSRWILWSSDGFFDCSEGADMLIGWHLNQGADKEGLFFPAAQFFEQYYTPNLGMQILKGIKSNKEQSIISFSLPPSVRIVSPFNNTTLTNEQQKITVKATDLGGGIDEVRLYHNGKHLDGTTRGFKSTGQNHEFTVTLTNGENRIKATAFNSQRTESIPDEIVVHYKAPEVVKPNMHILAVGINNYLNPKYNLNYAKNDADAFVKSLSAGATTLFGKVEVTEINDANATKSGILSAIEKIKATANAEDVFVFYYAGHGVMSSGNGVEKPQFYLVPHDVTKMYEADEMLKKSGISATEIGEFSKTIKAQKQFFVIDACQSGGAMQTLAMRGAAEEKAIAQLARSTGTYFIAASGTEQFATEVAELGHGIFTYSVIEALKGSCKSQDGKVTVNQLKSCVEDLVPELSKKHKGQPQFPTGYGFGMDFPVVMVK
jgi:WD40 repeat protein